MLKLTQLFVAFLLAGCVTPQVVEPEEENPIPPFQQPLNTGGDADTDSDSDSDSDSDADSDTDADSDADTDSDTDTDTDTDGNERTWYLDADDDGYGRDDGSVEQEDAPSDAYVLLGGDCDDLDPDVHPNAVELENDIDDDCNNLIDDGTPAFDEDEDGYPVAEDCDDEDASINPGMTELCDGFDNDCDGMIDEDVKLTFYIDSDGDGHGDRDQEFFFCEIQDGYVTAGADCDDGDDEVHPGAVEYCDGFDNDCDDEIDEDTSHDVMQFFEDLDGDGYGNDDEVINACYLPDGYSSEGEDCDDEADHIYPDAEDFCILGEDEDCDGDSSDDEDDCNDDMDDDNVGYPLDCDDTDEDVNQFVTEVCDDEIDNDCDGDVDEDDAHCSDVEGDADTDVDADSDTDTDSDSDSDVDTDTDSDSDADADADVDTDTDADTDTGESPCFADTGLADGLCLTCEESAGIIYYQLYGNVADAQVVFSESALNTDDDTYAFMIIGADSGDVLANRYYVSTDISWQQTEMDVVDHRLEVWDDFDETVANRAQISLSNAQVAGDHESQSLCHINGDVVEYIGD